MLSLLVLSFFTSVNPAPFVKNPIVPDRGVNDPHIHIFNDTAYLYATHDRSMENKAFAMDDWWVWSSVDLVNWTLESVLKPGETYIGKPFDQCWATDAAHRNGQYYWYFSEGNEQTGVVVGPTPAGPWKDPLGKPLLDSTLTPTHEYDISLFQDADGEFYMLFGVWNYYMARLNDDMVSLAEEPREIIINNPVGPYGEGSTDDKPFLHHYQGRYYLSWGAFYATSKELYGPYEYAGTVMDSGSFAPGYAEPTWPNGPLQGRHGSFFEWHNQTYFAYCDISQTGNRRFRDTFISYVHYRNNGEIAPVRVDGIGVGEYDANRGVIQAEDYFKSEGISKRENPEGGFMVDGIDAGDFLIYPNIRGLEGKNEIHITLAANKNFRLALHRDSPDGELLGQWYLEVDDQEGFQSIVCRLSSIGEKESICFLFDGAGKDLCRIDSFYFQ